MNSSGTVISSIPVWLSSSNLSIKFGLTSSKPNLSPCILEGKTTLSAPTLFNIFSCKSLVALAITLFTLLPSLSLAMRVVDCTDEESMKESGILEMNTVVVGISEPIEASITTTLIAKDSEGSKVKRVIARATSDLHEKMLKRVGADKVVFPSRMQGERLGLELVRPNLIERLELDNQTGIDEITVPEEFIGRSLRDLNLRKNYLVNVLAAGPAEELTVNPPAKYILERGNILVVMGKTIDLQKLPQN